MSLDSTGTLTNATDGKTDNEAKLKYVSEVEFLPENEANSWCYLFIHHTKIDIVNRRLIRNFPTFIHTSICYKRENKHIKKEERPTISGLLFVQGDVLQVQSFLSENFFGLHLVKDCSTKRIATISDKVMQSFMRISQISPTRIRFMDHPFDYYSTGNPLVKITSGVLAGMEGFRIRIARDKCLVTTIGGMTVAISGIHKDSFENLDTYVKLRKEQLKDDRVGTIALTPLQSEIDRCFFPPQTQMDILAIIGNVTPWMVKANYAVEVKDFDKAVEIVLFLLEEIGSMLQGIKDSRLNDSKDILSLSRDADAVLLSLLDNKETPTNLKEIVETERQSLAIRFPLLPIEI